MIEHMIKDFNIPMLLSLARLCFLRIFCSVLSFFVGPPPRSNPRVTMVSPLLDSKSVSDSGNDVCWYLDLDWSRATWKIWPIIKELEIAIDHRECRHNIWLLFAFART